LSGRPNYCGGDRNRLDCLGQYCHSVVPRSVVVACGLACDACVLHFDDVGDCEDGDEGGYEDDDEGGDGGFLPCLLLGGGKLDEACRLLPCVLVYDDVLAYDLLVCGLPCLLLDGGRLDEACRRFLVCFHLVVHEDGDGGFLPCGLHLSSHACCLACGLLYDDGIYLCLQWSEDDGARHVCFHRSCLHPCWELERRRCFLDYLQDSNLLSSGSFVLVGLHFGLVRSAFVVLD